MLRKVRIQLRNKTWIYANIDDVYFVYAAQNGSISYTESGNHFHEHGDLYRDLQFLWAETPKAIAERCHMIRLGNDVFVQQNRYSKDASNIESYLPEGSNEESYRAVSQINEVWLNPDSVSYIAVHKGDWFELDATGKEPVVVNGQHVAKDASVLIFEDDEFHLIVQGTPKSWDRKLHAASEAKAKAVAAQIEAEAEAAKQEALRIAREEQHRRQQEEQGGT